MRNERKWMVGTAVGIVFGCGCAGCRDGSATTNGGGSDAGAVVDVQARDVEDAAPILPGDLSVTACPGAPSVPVPPTAPSCDTICSDAHCLPAALLTGVDSTAIPGCPDDGTGTPGKCFPDAISMTGGRYESAPCASSLVKGQAACIPYCLAGLFKDVLKRDSCAAGEVCAPCADPMTQQPTGACEDRCSRGADGGVDAGPDGDATLDGRENAGGDAGTPEDPTTGNGG